MPRWSELIQSDDFKTVGLLLSKFTQRNTQGYCLWFETEVLCQRAYLLVVGLLLRNLNNRVLVGKHSKKYPIICARDFYFLLSSVLPSHQPLLLVSPVFVFEIGLDFWSFAPLPMYSILPCFSMSFINPSFSFLKELATLALSQHINYRLATFAQITQFSLLFRLFWYWVNGRFWLALFQSKRKRFFKVASVGIIHFCGNSRELPNLLISLEREGGSKGQEGCCSLLGTVPSAVLPARPSSTTQVHTWE